MDSLPLHPLVVHLPVALSVLMPLVFGVLLFAWWRGWVSQRGWLLGVGLQAILVITAFVALRTGEADEEVVEHSLLSEAPLEFHEEAAEMFFLFAIAVLVVAGIAAFLPREKLAKLAAGLSVAGALVVLALGIRVGHAGGELVYREGAAAAHVERARAAAAGKPLPETGEGDSDSDDD